MLSSNDTQHVNQLIQTGIQTGLNQREASNQFQKSPIAMHTHNGTDASRIDQNDIANGAKGLGQQYFSREYDNGSVTGTATINWANGNVQHVTLTGNTTLAFTNAQSGMRAILQIAGGYTPTFPSTVRWGGGTTPTATATAGHKDIYTFVYSGKESLFDGVQAANFAIT